MRKYILLQLLLFAGFTAFGYGGTPPPIYVGPGAAGSNLPHMQKPAFTTRDTAVTYISANKSQGAIFNGMDVNQLYLQQIHRSWNRNLPHLEDVIGLNLSVGGLAYQGNYSYRHNAIPEQRYTYWGAGITASAEFNVHLPYLELHGGFQAVHVREDGPLHSFLKNPEFVHQGHPVAKIENLWNKKHLHAQKASAGIRVKPFRYASLGASLGFGHTIRYVGLWRGLYAGYGPVSVYYTSFSLQIMARKSENIGVSVSLPNFRKHKIARLAD